MKHGKTLNSKKLQKTNLTLVKQKSPVGGFFRISKKKKTANSTELAVSDYLAEIAALAI